MVHTSRPFWSRVLSIAGSLDPHSVAFAVSRPEVITKPTRVSRNTPPAPSPKQHRPRGNRHSRVDSASYISPQITTEKAQHKPIRSRNPADTVPGAFAYYQRNAIIEPYQKPPPSEPYNEDCPLLEDAPLLEDCPRRKRARGGKQPRARVGRTIGVCKNWVRSMKGSKDGAPGNRNSQQYVSEWAEEVHGASQAPLASNPNERPEKADKDVKGKKPFQSLRGGFGRIRHKIKQR